jgi:hypothetical protein
MKLSPLEVELGKAAELDRGAKRVVAPTITRRP